MEKIMQNRSNQIYFIIPASRSVTFWIPKVLRGGLGAFNFVIATDSKHSTENLPVKKLPD
jgi:hypothetical protein